MTATAVRPPRTVLGSARLLVFLVLVVMFVPIRRYSLPSALPVHLEPYRLVLVLLTLGTLLSLLVDRRWRLRRLGFGGVFAALVVTSLVSIALNLESIAEEGLTATVVTKLFLLLSLVSAYLVVRLLIASEDHVRVLVRALVGSAAVVALAAIVESRIKRNLFDAVLGAVPVLERTRDATAQVRGSALRAIGSAQHSIALGALLASVLPLAVYLLWRDAGERGQRRWVWGCATGVIVLGVVATVSRTAALMLVVAGVVGLALRPRAVTALAVACLPVLLVVYLALPAPTRALTKSFFPSSGLLAQQQGREGSNRSTGRLADVGPTVDNVGHRPLFGRGYGTRVVEGPRTNAALIDNEYLSRAEETGLIGLLPLVLLILLPLGRMWQRARTDASWRGDLAAALACSFAGYGLSLFLYGGWAYAQEVLVFFMLVAVAGWLVTEGTPDRLAARASPPPE